MGLSRERPAVSICIPASRDPHGLRAAVLSVLAQDYDDLEVVITDDSGGALEPVARELDDGRVRYFANTRRLGLAGNHMAALDRARGRYLGFLHDDDRFLPTYVGTVAAALTADPSLGVVFTDCWIDSGVEPYTRRRVALTGGRYEHFLPQVVRYDYFLPSVTMVRREVWESSSQAWPDLVAGDLALFVDAALAGWPFLYLDEPLVVYRLHPGQIGSDEEKTRGDMVAFWQRYRFDDPEAERLRREKVAHWLRACAGAHLKHGRAEEARADLERARELDPRRRGPRECALRLLAAHPAMVPWAHRLWRRLRPAPSAMPLARD
jgi:glycosyltransferase involved in cell wall biosynthesis